MHPVLLAPALTPHGNLLLAQEDDALGLDAAVAQRLQAAFARGAGHGLLQLGASEVGTALPAVFSYWREFAARYVTALCTHPGLSAGASGAQTVEAVATPPDAELEWLAVAAPLMTGAKYLTGAVLRVLWKQMDKAFHLELSEQQCGVQEFLKRRNPAWNLVGRVCFNLAENRGDAESPFAFLATYSVRLSAHSKAQHLPLGQALREYEGPANRDRLLSLLLPVQRAAESCPWLKAMDDGGEIFHHLRWTPVLGDEDLSKLFGLDMAASAPPVKPTPSTKTRLVAAMPKPAKKAVKPKAKPVALTAPVAKKKQGAAPPKPKPTKKSASKGPAPRKKPEIASPKSSLPAAKKKFTAVTGKVKSGTIH